MSLFISILKVAIRSWFKPRVSDFGEPIVERFRVQLWDLDLFVHMNNAKYLNYMEATRWALVFRMKWFAKSFRQGWMLPIARIDIKYLRSLKLWQKFEVRCQVVAVESRWIYLYQQFVSGDKLICHALVRTLIYSKQGALPPEVYLPKIGVTATQVKVPDEIREWLADFTKREARSQVRAS